MTQLLSQNGWPVRDSTDGLTRFAAVDRDWWAANADVAVVFSELIERYDLEVEDIEAGKVDDWSWAKRPIRGQTKVQSNHGSATAIDLNALKHPRGVANTFTRHQLEAGVKIRLSITDDQGRPVLRWGQFFTTTVDGMHWEIIGTPAQVKQAADIIRARRKALGLMDMQWTDKIKLTKHDAKIWTRSEPGTTYVEGQLVSVGMMLRNPTGVRELQLSIDNVVRMITVPPKPAPPKAPTGG
jgi:hypothetical protein